MKGLRPRLGRVWSCCSLKSCPPETFAVFRVSESALTSMVSVVAPICITASTVEVLSNVTMLLVVANFLKPGIATLSV